MRSRNGVVSLHDFVFRHRMTSPSHTIADPRNVDLGIVCGDEIQIRAVAKALRVLQEGHFSSMRHDGFERKRNSRFQESLPEEIRSNGGHVGIRRIAIEDQSSFSDREPLRQSGKTSLSEK